MTGACLDEAKENAEKKLDDRRYYLAKCRRATVAIHARETNALVDRLRADMLRNVSALLQDAGGEEGISATGKSGTAALVAPMRNAPTSDAQCLRLYSQAAATMEVFQNRCDRDTIHLAEYESVLQVLTAAGVDSTAWLRQTTRCTNTLTRSRPSASTTPSRLSRQVGWNARVLITSRRRFFGGLASSERSMITSNTMEEGYMRESGSFSS